MLRAVPGPAHKPSSLSLGLGVLLLQGPLGLTPPAALTGTVQYTRAPPGLREGRLIYMERAWVVSCVSFEYHITLAVRSPPCTLTTVHDRDHSRRKTENQSSPAYCTVHSPPYVRE